MIKIYKFSVFRRRRSLCLSRGVYVRTVLASPAYEPGATPSPNRYGGSIVQEVWGERETFALIYTDFYSLCLLTSFTVVGSMLVKLSICLVFIFFIFFIVFPKKFFKNVFSSCLCTSPSIFKNLFLPSSMRLLLLLL